MSEDGLLLQVSLMSEKHEVEFADRVTETITASYIEFVQRLVLPEFKDVPGDEVIKKRFTLTASYNSMRHFSLFSCDTDQRIS